MDTSTNLSSAEFKASSASNVASDHVSRRQIMKVGALAVVSFSLQGCSKKGEESSEAEEVSHIREKLPDVPLSIREQELTAENLVEVLQGSYGTMEVLEEIARQHHANSFRDSVTGNYRTDYLYSKKYVDLLADALSIMNLTVSTCRQALRDPEFAEERWHLHPTYMKAALVVELLKNHEFIDSRQNRGRSPIDGTIYSGYEFRAAATISVEQLSRNKTRNGSGA